MHILCILASSQCTAFGGEGSQHTLKLASAPSLCTCSGSVLISACVRAIADSGSSEYAQPRRRARGWEPAMGLWHQGELGGCPEGKVGAAVATSQLCLKGCAGPSMGSARSDWRLPLPQGPTPWPLGCPISQSDPFLSAGCFRGHGACAGAGRWCGRFWSRHLVRPWRPHPGQFLPFS